MGNKSKSKKPEVMSRSNVNKLLSKFLVLTIAYLMEETEFNSVEKLMDFYDGILRWLNAVQDHLITVNKARELVEEHTGRKVYF